MKRGTVLAATAVCAAVAAPSPVAAQASDRANVIFLHPDGTAANHWNNARAYWAGPDGTLSWDRLPYKAVYRGHMKDAVYSSSNAAATTHAFGFKTSRPGSFGKDGDGDAARTIDALSGYTGSLMRQAGNAGHPVGVVNDGTVTEPGTGAFLAEVGNRSDNAGIALQMVTGRPGEDDEDPQVIMGGGEQWFLPAPTDAERASAERTNGYHGWGAREDGRNLVQEAEDRGTSWCARGRSSRRWSTS